MDILFLPRGRSDKARFFRNVNLLGKVVRWLKIIFGFRKTEEQVEVTEPVSLYPEAEAASRTYTSSKELQLTHSAKEPQRQVVRRKISWSVIKIVDDLPIKRFLRVLQWRVVFKWRGPPRALFAERIFAQL